IAPEMLPHVFDLFAQADRSLDRARGGLGIGLTLVRTLVEMHGGHVEVRSQGLGKGSEFVLRLPAVVPPSAEPAEAGSPPLRAGNRIRDTGYGMEREADVHPRSRAAQPASRISNLVSRILVVEDNADTAGMLASLL